jgi:hypothetical protein
MQPLFKVSLGAVNLNTALRRDLNGDNLILVALKLIVNWRKIFNRGTLNHLPVHETIKNAKNESSSCLHIISLSTTVFVIHIASMETKCKTSLGWFL